METPPQGPEEHMALRQNLVRPTPAETERLAKVKMPWMTVAERENMDTIVIYE